LLVDGGGRGGIHIAGLVLDRWREGRFQLSHARTAGRNPHANLLAAALFCRLYRETGEKKFLEPRCERRARRSRGSSPMGRGFTASIPHSAGLIIFTHGYNLGALRSMGRSLETEEFEPSVRRGFEFYRTHFFRQDSAPSISTTAFTRWIFTVLRRGILTLLEFRDLDPGNVELAHSVFDWAMNHIVGMSAFFCLYYVSFVVCTIRTSYYALVARRGCWLALSSLLNESGEHASTSRGSPRNSRAIAGSSVTVSA